MDDSGDGARERGKLSAAISNAIVGIHSEYLGRGAKRTRTVMGADYVERLSKRKIVGILSQVHVDPDLAVETFILEPPSTDGAGATADA